MLPIDGVRLATVALNWWRLNMLNPRLAVLLVFLTTSARAQWLQYPSPGTPRTRDGKPNLAAKTPRTSDGKPDLSGVWQTEYAPPGENEKLFGDVLKDFVVPGDDPLTFSKYFLNILADFKPEEAPMRPEAAALFRKHFQGGNRESPSTRCVPQGIPRGDLDNYLPFKIIQTPGLVAVLYEQSNTYRQIYTDGRKLPVDPQPTWMGYSVGRWEGDIFVVDATGFNNQGWLDAIGHPQSEELRVRERFHRRDFGHMDLDLTINDPKTYTMPFTVKATEVLIPDSDVLEYVCTENERDRGHLERR
jgi:hypothetical protein